MKSRALLALTASALAIPGIAGKARADTPPTQSTLSYRLSSYQEDDLPAAERLGGALERYDITIHQFRLLSPLGERWSLTVDSSIESMSGASPWYLLRQGEAEAGVVMSGATISERRRDLVLAARRYLDNGSWSVEAGTSREDDYDSVSGGLGFERHFNNELTTLAAGMSYSSDDIHPTDAALFGRVAEADKRTSSVFASVTQVIDQRSLFQTALNFTRHSGFLSDPYKLADVRPDSRNQWAWTSAWRRFFAGPEAALHANYRLYSDSFGVDSHTVELAWYQNLGDRFQLTPGLRYYSQSAADFYRPAVDFTLGQQHQSTDYRLSAYGAVSGTLQFRMELDELALTLGAERYVTDASYSLFDVDVENPALVNFTRLSLGIDWSF